MNLKTRQCFLLLITFILVACAPAPTPNPNAPNLAKILKLSEIRAISLEDDWNGASHYGPVVAHYTVKPKGSDFLGDSAFNAGADSGTPIHSSEKISIPATVVQDVVNKLAEAYIQEGEYKPRLAWEDDFPSLRLSFELQNDTLSFYTTSQGSAHAPWGMTYQGKSYIIDSGVPMKAFKLFDPYLKHKELKQLIDKVMDSPFPTATVTP